MQLVEKYKWLIVIIVAAVVVVGGLAFLDNNSNKSEDKTTKNQEKKDAEAKKKSEEDKKKQEAAKADTGIVTYTARPGDSYTVLARKAVQVYTSDAKTNVSQAQIVAAETFLTVDAGSQLLNLGQKVTLDKSVVSKAVKKAQALSAAELAARQTYVPYVNFDTSNNG